MGQNTGRPQTQSISYPRYVNKRYVKLFNDTLEALNVDELLTGNFRLSSIAIRRGNTEPDILISR